MALASAGQRFRPSRQPRSLRLQGFRRSNPTPHTITLYASSWSSPSTTQHWLPGRRYPLPGPDFWIAPAPPGAPWPRLKARSRVGRADCAARPGGRGEVGIDSGGGDAEGTPIPQSARELTSGTRGPPIKPIFLNWEDFHYARFQLDSQTVRNPVRKFGRQGPRLEYRQSGAEPGP